MATIKKGMEIIWHTADEKPTEDCYCIIAMRGGDGRLYCLDGYDYCSDCDEFVSYNVYAEGSVIRYIFPKSKIAYWARKPEFPLPRA